MFEVISAVVGFLLGIGVVYKYVKSAMMPLKEVGELILTVVNALEDKQLTKEEIEKIIKEAQDVPKAVKEALESIKK